MKIAGQIVAAIVLGTCLFVITDPESKYAERAWCCFIAASILIFVV